MKNLNIEQEDNEYKNQQSCEKYRGICLIYKGKLISQNISLWINHEK